MGKSRVVGVDVGTMFFQVSEMIDDKIKIKNTRNAFVELPPNDDIEDVLRQYDRLKHPNPHPCLHQ